MEHPFGAFSGASPAGQSAPRERSTFRDAPMTLFLRIETERGPRTVIASGLSLEAASDIADAITEAGHYAEFVDECPHESLADLLSRRKFESEFPAAAAAGYRKSTHS